VLSIRPIATYFSGAITTRYWIRVSKILNLAEIWAYTYGL